MWKTVKLVEATQTQQAEGGKREECLGATELKWDATSTVLTVHTLQGGRVAGGLAAASTS